MNQNKLLNILCSLPVVLVILYYLPFLGICLTIVRLFTMNNKKHINTSIAFIVISLILFIPSVLNKIVNITKLTIPYLNEITKSNMYSPLINYSKFLFTAGVIFLILSVIFKKLFNKVIEYIKQYLHRKETIEREISEKNDLKIKEKQERAKTTHVVYCPHCGANNILTEKIGKCNYCRRQIQYKG